MLGDAVEVTEGYRTLVVLRPPLHRLAGLRLRVRLRAAARAGGLRALRGGGRGVRARLPRAAAAPAARGRRRSWARSSASTSPTRASGTRAWTSWSASSTPPRKPRRARPGASSPSRQRLAGLGSDVAHLAPVSPPGDEAGVAQHAEVLGHAARARVQPLRELLRAGGELGQDLRPALAEQRAERVRRASSPAPTVSRCRARCRRSTAATAGRTSPTRAAS